MQMQRKPTQKGKKGVPVQWAWDVHRTRIVRLLATALQVDLRQLYSMSQPEESLVAFFAKYDSYDQLFFVPLSP
jgi:condensin complex subunit 1